MLHGGSDRGHRASPAASLWVEKVFCLSVFLSEMAMVFSRVVVMRIVGGYWGKMGGDDGDFQELQWADEE